MIQRRAGFVLLLLSPIFSTQLSLAADDPQAGRDIARPRAVAGTLPAGFGFGSNPADKRKSLPQINRSIAIDVAELIKTQKLAEAQALLDEADKDLRAFAGGAHLEFWDSSIAPVMRLIDTRRDAIQRAQPQFTQPAGTKAAPPPRLTPDQNRALTAIRTDLNLAGTQIRTGKLADAERTLRSAQSRLRALSGNARVPIWSIPIASAFQTADTHRGALKARQMEEREAQEKAAAAAVSATRPAAAQPPPSGLPVGASAPAFEAMTLDGTPFTTNQLKGKWVLLDFWSTWCVPCRAEIPHLKEAYDAFGQDKRFVMLSLSEDIQIGTPAAFTQQNQMLWPQGFIGEESPILQDYHVTGIPTILLINPEGKIAANGLRGAAIKQKLAEVLAAPAQPARSK